MKNEINNKDRFSKRKKKEREGGREGVGRTKLALKLLQMSSASLMMRDTETNAKQNELQTQTHEGGETSQ